ncbi:MAG: hypothetical protein QM778_33235 [Myxococcales bacterium]
MSDLHEKVAPSGAEVLGIDEGKTWEDWRSAMVAHLDTDEAKKDAEKHYATKAYNDTLYMRVVRRTAMGGRIYWKAECLSGLPDDRMKISLDLEQEHWLSSETKHAFAILLHRMRHCGTWDAAQRRASDATIVVADSV